ncbi:MAG: hypothetical protein LH629_13820, partial [Ignavibacteria bacterium]|nr:hypothetical protein [Ignavibacteria bacterium]
MEIEIIEVCSDKSKHALLPSIADFTDIHYPVNNPYGISSDKLIEFSNALSSSDHSSIDAFCFDEATPFYYVDISRIAIAHNLDQKRNQYLKNKPKDWIEELFKIITEFADENTLIPGSLS